MKFTKLCPNIFYTDIRIGLRLFVECLGFNITFEDPNAEHPFYAIERDNLAIHLIQDKEFADKDRPELRLVTPDINEAYTEIAQKFPDLLHPNLKKVTLRPWGAKEFALKDESDVCIIIQEWS
jgi:hypothetical protein